METVAAAQHRVGTFQFTVTEAEDSPESRRRWEARAEALASWLLSEWQRERANHSLPTAAMSPAERN